MWPSVSFCSADLLVITSLKPGEGMRRTRWNFPVLKPKSVVGSLFTEVGFVHRGYCFCTRHLQTWLLEKQLHCDKSWWTASQSCHRSCSHQYWDTLTSYPCYYCTKKNTVLKALPEMLYLTQVKRKLHPFSRRQLSGTVTKYLKELNLKAEGLVWDFRFWGLGVWLTLSLWGLILENHGLCWGRLLTSW